MKLEPILRLPAVVKASGHSRAALYKNIREGLWTKPINIGERAIGWPESEIAALNAYRIAGKSDDQIRKLVMKLEAARKTAAEGIDDDSRK